jgi:hypothetical protein
VRTNDTEVLVICDVPLDEENLSAKLADGVLTVFVPRRPKASRSRSRSAEGTEPKQLKE